MLFLSTFLERIQRFDLDLLVWINSRLSHPWLDTILPWFRESLFWMPLYLFLISWGIMNLGKKGGWWVAWAVITVGLSDQISSTFIKNSVARIRPCRDPEVLPQIILRLENCSGSFSFTSSHAANHFALAMFVFGSLSPVVGSRYTRWLFLWAAAICYAQVYVGVHYPLDIVGGALVGLLSGWITSRFYRLKSKAMDLHALKVSKAGELPGNNTRQ